MNTSLPTSSPAAGAIMVSEWTVGTPGRQRALIDAFSAAWQQIPWPDGLLSATLLASSDGAVVLNYGHWANTAAYEKFLQTHQTHRQSLTERLEAAVPGIQRKPPVNCAFGLSLIPPRRAV